MVELVLCIPRKQLQPHLATDTALACLPPVLTSLVCDYVGFIEIDFEGLHTQNVGIVRCFAWLLKVKLLLFRSRENARACRQNFTLPPLSLEHFQLIRRLLPHIHKLLTTSTDREVLLECFGAVMHLGEHARSDEVIASIVQSGLLPALVKHVADNPSTRERVSAIRALGTICSSKAHHACCRFAQMSAVCIGDFDAATQAVIDAGFLAALKLRVAHEADRNHRDTVAEIAFSLSNILGCSEPQIQASFLLSLWKLIVRAPFAGRAGC